MIEQNFVQHRVWCVLTLQEDIPPSTIASITFLIGHFYRAGYTTIYIYDPKRAFPEIVRKSLANFFMDRVEDLIRLGYTTLLYDKAREHLSEPWTALGMAPIGVAPSLLDAQVEDIDLLPLEGSK
jgi:hypothetical protein